jgi:hypothetical protein
MIPLGVRRSGREANHLSRLLPRLRMSGDIPPFCRIRLGLQQGQFYFTSFILARAQAVSHRPLTYGETDSIPGHSLWDLSWTGWQWNGFLFRILRVYPISIIPSVLHIYIFYLPLALYNLSNWHLPCHCSHGINCLASYIFSMKYVTTDCYAK